MHGVDASEPGDSPSHRGVQIQEMLSKGTPTPPTAGRGGGGKSRPSFGRANCSLL